MRCPLSRPPWTPYPTRSAGWRCIAAAVASPGLACHVGLARWPVPARSSCPSPGFYDERPAPMPDPSPSDKPAAKSTRPAVR
jgi:hypothetical protein